MELSHPGRQILTLTRRYTTGSNSWVWLASTTGLWEWSERLFSSVGASLCFGCQTSLTEKGVRMCSGSECASMPFSMWASSQRATCMSWSRFGSALVWWAASGFRLAMSTLWSFCLRSGKQLWPRSGTFKKACSMWQQLFTFGRSADTGSTSSWLARSGWLYQWSFFSGCQSRHVGWFKSAGLRRLAKLLRQSPGGTRQN